MDSGMRHLVLLLLVGLGTAVSGCAMVLPLKTGQVPVEGGPEETTAKPSLTWRGIIHVHSEFSHDSKASLKQIARAARQAGLDFVIVTDHNIVAPKSAYEERYPLLILGEEISTPDGHLLAVGIQETAPTDLSSQALIDWIHARDGYAIIAHPLSVKKPWQRWDLRGIDAMEIYNFGHALYAANKLKLAFRIAFSPPSFFLRSFQERPDEGLAFWDERLRRSRIAAVVATDAHIHWQWGGFHMENLLMFFQAATMYVPAEALEEKQVLRALAEGRHFMAFEARGLARGFGWGAERDHVKIRSGDVVKAGGEARFWAGCPLDCSLRLYHNGRVIARGEDGPEKEPWEWYAPLKRGAYRLEADHKGRIWIITNPIYVE